MFYDPAYYTDHYNRAYQRMGWVEQRFGRTARVVAAVGMTALRVLGDLVVIFVGTFIFAIDAIIRINTILLRSVGGWIARRIGGRDFERRMTRPPSRWKW